MPPRLLVIYDGDCRFCRFGIHLVRKLDRRGMFDFCPAGNPVAESVLVGIPSEERYKQMHVATPTGLLSGTDAAEAMLKELPFGHLLRSVGLHRMYPLLARYRWALGRLSPHLPAVVTCGNGTGDGVAARSA
jgi:predicted DCC family thiol-disulfide oxidoreductase YuxK